MDHGKPYISDNATKTRFYAFRCVAREAAVIDEAVEKTGLSFSSLVRLLFGSFRHAFPSADGGLRFYISGKDLQKLGARSLFHPDAQVKPEEPGEQE